MDLDAQHAYCKPRDVQIVDLELHGTETSHFR